MMALVRSNWDRDPGCPRGVYVPLGLTRAPSSVLFLRFPSETPRAVTSGSRFFSVWDRVRVCTFTWPLFRRDLVQDHLYIQGTASSREVRSSRTARTKDRKIAQHDMFVHSLMANRHDVVGAW